MRFAVRTAAGVLVLLLALGVSGCQLLGRSAADGLQGRLVWPKDGDLWVYDMASKQQQKVTSLPRGAAVTAGAWSPDGQRIIYSQFWRRPEERATGADLFVARADGSEARPFAERDAPNSILETPDWAPSGRVYYTLRKVADGRESTSIVRQIEGGQPEVVVENGYSPSISADESTLVFVRTTRVGQMLIKKQLDQPGEGCELLSDSVFTFLSQPRISPDGTRVAVGGSGEPTAGPSSCGGDNRTKSSSPASAPVAFDLAGLLGVATAHAHGLPSDVWTVNLDGSNLVRIADIKEDDPTVAWSPDGARMAIFGVAALYVVDARGGPAAKLVDQGGYGALDWTR